MNNVYLIGSAHLDPVWLWRKPEGLSEILSTFRSALDRMDEFPDYIFTSACAYYYRWVEEVDPVMFEEIRERVRQGRWTITGGFWIQPDCNIPSGESFARHLLFSQNYFEEKFGQRAKTGYNVDSFGHNGMLPQIFAKGGIDSYVYMRPESHEQRSLPQDLFLWESPDGSKVTAYRIACGYNDDWALRLPEKSGEELSLRKSIHALGLAEKTGHPHMCFYGVGNHGGGPTIRGLKALTTLCEERSEFAFAAPDKFFEDVGQSGCSDKLAVFKGDLQHHASGCYSASNSIKTANRRAENMLVSAEKFDLIASRLCDVPLHSGEIELLWKKVMFNQFHDILAGCVIEPAIEDALAAFGAAQDGASETAQLALHRISWNIRTTRVLDQVPAQKNGWILWEKSGEGAPLVLFNPHSFPLRLPVQTSVQVNSVANSDGFPVPVQTVRGFQTNEEDLYASLFYADLPALGYATYYIYKEEKLGVPPLATLEASSARLENQYIRADFDPHTGLITSLFDKEKSRELAREPLGAAVVIDDSASDTWAHKIDIFDQEIGRFETTEVRLLEKGPVRAVVQTTSRFGSSELVQQFALCAEGRGLEVKCCLNWQEKHQIVKLSFPVLAEAPLATYSMPYGFISKPADGCEEPSHEWMCVTGSSDGYGLALLNDCKYSFSVKDGDMRMIAARSAAIADHFGKRDDQMNYLDAGLQTFRYALTPCFLNSMEAVVNQAAALNTPPEQIMETHHDGNLPPVWSGIEIGAENVTAQILKLAQDQKGYVIRLVETAGRDVETTVSLPLLNCTFPLNIGHQEVKTYYIPLNLSETPREVDFTERFI